MSNFIIHQSDAPDVLWYIDNVEDAGDTYKINGWLAHVTKPVKDILINNQSVNPVFYDRPDVLKVYKRLTDPMVGININVPKDKITERVDIVLEDGSRENNVGSLIKWIVFHSGFKRTHKDIIVVNDFYNDPDLVRNFAIKNIGFQSSDYHRGKRSKERYIIDGTMEKFESIIGRKIINWNYDGYANGMFQYCTSTDPIVYHVDSQNYAAMVYLTPNAPLNSGTSFFKSKITGATAFETIDDRYDEYDKTFRGISKDLNFYDKTQFELIDTVGNVYNRLVLFNAKAIHAAAEYFGDSIETARFFHLFFFDVE